MSTDFRIINSKIIINTYFHVICIPFCFSCRSLFQSSRRAPYAASAAHKKAPIISSHLFLQCENTIQAFIFLPAPAGVPEPPAPKLLLDAEASCKLLVYHVICPALLRLHIQLKGLHIAHLLIQVILPYILRYLYQIILCK